MAEPQKISEVIKDLEIAQDYYKQIQGGLAEAGLSFEAKRALDKLRVADPTLKWYRAYKRTPNEFSLWDLLSERDLEIREYKLTSDEPIHLAGETAATRDKIWAHTTNNPLYEDLWIGEELLHS